MRASFRGSSLLFVALALSVAGCATGGTPAPDLAYEELVGLWETGDVANGLVTGRVTFLDDQRVLLQCDPVVPMSPSQVPRQVTRRGRGWAFPGCDGEVVVRRDAAGVIEARADVSRSRATTTRACEDREITAQGTRCVRYGDATGSTGWQDNQLIGFWRVGGSPPSTQRL